MKKGIAMKELAHELIASQESGLAVDRTLSAPLIAMTMGEPLPPVETEYEALDSLLSRIATDFDGNPMVGPVIPIEQMIENEEAQRIPRIPLINVDNGTAILQPNRVFHNQLANELRIPYEYYKRQYASHPDDLVRSVNSWLQDTEVVRNTRKPVHGVRTIRSLGNVARAFVSNKYRTLDNLPLLMAVMNHLANLDVTEENVVSCYLNDQKMFVKVVTPKLEGEVEKGDIVQAGVEISNSEVGRGSLSVKPLIYRLICLNGAVMEDKGIRKVHIGRAQMGEETNGWEVYSDETRRKADEAFFAEVGDVIKHTLSEEVFDMELQKIRAANSDEIAVEPTVAVERVANTYQFSEDEQTAIMNNFMRESKPTRWAMANAVTLASQKDEVSYERATEMERIGGQIIEDDSTWKGIVRL